MTPQDPPAAARHLRAAIAAIEAEFGADYAAKHPELVASLVQSATIEAAVATGHGAHREVLELAQGLTSQICETLLRLKPKFFGG